MSAELHLPRPDDWHLHLRDGDALRAVLPFTVQRFGRAVVMPNLKPPITTTAMAVAYRERIMAALPRGASFVPLMTLYLTDTIDPDEIRRGREQGLIFGCKLYPAGVTTNSEQGVTDISRLEPALAAMMDVDMPLLVHGELSDPKLDVFDLEARFIDRVLAPIVERWPHLRIVFEHVTTRAAVDFVRTARTGVAATITPQHLMLNRNALFAGGLRPHHYCLPLLKTEVDRRSLLDVVASANPRFFLGTDSAPHPRGGKESACGCAGIFSAHAGIELYAEIFESEGILARLQGFACEYGPDFYQLPRCAEHIVLVREPWTVPDSYPFAGQEQLIPFKAGQQIAWRLQTQTR
jgi:dihydroorotase